MKILSIDTASNICGVSILEDQTLLCKLDTNTGRTHSENLMPMIKQAFSKTNLTIHDIDLLVCDIGPGSFTGIRIGVATAKAFQDSLCIPCVGISSLKSLAYSLNSSLQEKDIVCSMMDCKNENCYFALYKKEKATLNVLIEPQAESVETALTILKTYLKDPLEFGKITFVGDGTIPYSKEILNTFPKAFISEDQYHKLDSYALALAGLEEYSFEDKPQEILPLYLQKPQAQRQLEERENKNAK